MKVRSRCFLAFIFTTATLCVSPLARAQSAWSFSTIPTNGVIIGAPGQTIGWGYTVTNSSASDWLFVTDLETDSVFLHGTADSNPFDYPILAPNETVSVPYGGGVGLAELTWDQNAPAGFQNSGNFIMSAAWYDGDPFSGGQYVADAGQNTAHYIASVAVPEPSPLLLLGLGSLGLGAFTFRRRIHYFRTA